MSLDERSSPEALSLSRELADVLIVRRHDFAEGGLNDLLAAATRPWAFVVSDDEEPSAALWKIARRPTLPVAYRVLMLCPITRTTHYERGIEHQIRLFPRTAYRWEGDVNGDPVISVPRADLPYTVLWHYNNDAPLAEREAKARFTTDVVGDGTTYRYLHERHPEHVKPLSPELAAQVPKEWRPA